jgi:OTT_1508-like deaminase
MASPLKTLLESDESIWTWCEVNKEKFYASIFFLNTVRPNQRMIDNPTDPPPRVKPPEPRKDPTNELLDLLALLFARYKSNKSAKAQGTYPKVEGLRGAHGITSTALQFSSKEPSNPGTQNWTIYIAKNAGP